jgi:hypothetical protein
MSSQEPPYLYHYTKQQGLIGIVKGKSVWATDIRYLNDTAEFRYAVDIAITHLAAMSQEGKLPQPFVDQVTGYLKRPEGFYVFVFCLSAKRDLLSQWRAYGHGSDGFCIGFRAQDLRNAAAQQRFDLERCIYDVEEQKALMARTIDSRKTQLFRDADMFDIPHKGLTPPYHPRRGADPSAAEIIRNHAYLSAQELFGVAPTIKHPSFQEEEEWRLVWSPGWSEYERAIVKHRPSRTMLIPYREFKLSVVDDLGMSVDDDCGISEVIVGPTPYVELSIDSLKGFLKAQKLTACNVDKSGIPYREL